jgi:hypothetical protein
MQAEPSYASRVMPVGATQPNVLQIAVDQQSGWSATLICCYFPLALGGDSVGKLGHPMNSRLIFPVHGIRERWKSNYVSCATGLR